MSNSFPVTLDTVVNSKEIYYKFSLKTNSSSVMVQISDLGKVQFLSWDMSIRNWRVILEFPQDSCGYYGYCGANSICSMFDASLNCKCLIGYKPKNPRSWSVGSWSDGCVRNHPLNCSVVEAFKEVDDVKMPDFLQFWINESISLKECKAKCLKNCSCTAYANSDVTGSGHGCLLWFGDLIDVRKLSSCAKQKLYIRVKASDLESNSNKRKKIGIIALTIIASLLLLAFFSLIRRRILKGKQQGGQHTVKEMYDLPYFDICTIVRATQNFSDVNKIGEGGFGSVYKGLLSNGQYIAVKRLSKNSSQGIIEWKNEVILIAKLHHRNLVRLLGCCTQDEEMILIYEYISNGSLDSYISGGTKYNKKRLSLAWTKRFSIIIGIARGLLYLHQDSRLTIIHRDLKASNVLLDDEMNPKISDFGMARTFGEEQPPTMTKRVVGTFGYMAPEYATRGIFSMKSDVFSFGVLVLEIISGQRNSRFRHKDYDLSLLEYLWKLWNEGRSSEIIDPLLEDSISFGEVTRCIQIGLLCVQQQPNERPLMSTVTMMLDSEIVMLPRPKCPGFSVEVRDDNSIEKNVGTSNEVTNSLTEGR